MASPSVVRLGKVGRYLILHGSAGICICIGKLCANISIDLYHAYTMEDVTNSVN